MIVCAGERNRNVVPYAKFSSTCVKLGLVEPHGYPRHLGGRPHVLLLFHRTAIADMVGGAVSYRQVLAPPLLRSVREPGALRLIPKVEPNGECR